MFICVDLWPVFLWPQTHADEHRQGFPRAVSRTRTYFKGLAETAESRAAPTWINRDLDTLSGGIAKLPERHELSDIRLNEQLIVEFYSR